MATLQEILARAQALREETALGSISPERAGSIMYDTLQQINQMQLEGGSLVISKIYESVAAMQADTTPVSDLTGQDLRQGQLVVIVPSDTSSSDLGSVYRYNGTTEGASSWSFTGKIGGYPMDLGQKVDEGVVSFAIDVASAGLRDSTIKADGTWNTNTYYKHSLVNVEPGEHYKITANDENDATYAFFTDATVSLGNPAPFLPGTSRIIIPAGETQEFVIPTGCNYLFFHMGSISAHGTGRQNAPSSVIKTESAKTSDKNIASVLKSVNGELPLAWFVGFSVSRLDGTLATDSVNNRTCSDYVDLTGISKIIYTRPKSTSTSSNVSWGMAFYDSNKTYLSGQSVKTQESEQGYVVTERDIPEGAKYARFSKYSDDTLGEFYVLDANAILIKDAEFDVLKQDISNIEGDVSELDTRLQDVEQAMSSDVSYDKSLDLKYWDTLGGNYTVKAQYINSSGALLNGSTYRSAFIPITSGNKYEVKCGTSNGYVAILKAYNSAEQTLEYATGYSGRITIEEGGEYTFVAPEDANFLYVNLVSSNNEKDIEAFEILDVTGGIDSIESSPAKPDYHLIGLTDAVGNGLRELNPLTNSEGVVIPSTIQEENVIKRARQMTDIVWTTKKEMPCNNLQSYGNTGYFPAGETITGLPYSSTKEINKSIGFNVSIHTYMTALNNPYSLLYTENIRGSRSKSDWGRTYHGENCALYMGTVCSVFTGYAGGEKTAWGTGMYEWLRKYRYSFAKVGEQSSQGLKIGDIYWETGHTILIMGLKVDGNGRATSVLWGQSSGNHITYSWRSADWVDSYIKVKNAIIYRNIRLYQNNKYVPSPFVLIDDENLYEVGDVVFIQSGDSKTFYQCTTANRDSSFNAEKWSVVPEYNSANSYSIGSYVCVTDGSGDVKLYRVKYNPSADTFANNFEEVSALPWASYPFTYNNDICTFAGDMASFRENELIVLNYNLDSNPSHDWTAIELFKDGSLIETYQLSSIVQSELPEDQQGHALVLGDSLTYGKYKARLTDGENYSDFTYWEVLQTDVSFVKNFDNGSSKIAWTSANAKATHVALNTLTGSGTVSDEFNEDEISTGVAFRNLFVGDYGAVTNEPIPVVF